MFHIRVQLCVAPLASEHHDFWLFPWLSITVARRTRPYSVVGIVIWRLSFVVQRLPSSNNLVFGPIRPRSSCLWRSKFSSQNNISIGPLSLQS